MLIVHFAPVVRHADRECAFVVAAITRRRIIDSSGRRRITRAIARRIVATLVRIPLPIPLNLRHGLCSRITAQTLLHAKEFPIVGARGCVYAEKLRFLIDARIAIGWTWVIAQESSTAATLTLDGLEHVREVARIVTSICLDARAEQVRFGFVLATELQEINSEGCLGELT